MMQHKLTNVNQKNLHPASSQQFELRGYSHMAVQYWSLSWLYKSNKRNGKQYLAITQMVASFKSNPTRAETHLTNKPPCDVCGRQIAINK